MNRPPNSGALFRFAFVTVIFLFNFFSLVHLLFRRQAKVCVHSFTFGLTLVIVNGYLSTWIPYLFSSFIHETAWPILDLDTHCSIQRVLPVQISTILLVILCFRKVFEVFASKRAKLLCAFIFFTWVFPQTLYSIMPEISASKESDLYFVDSTSDPVPREDLLGKPSVRHGILFCIHQLDSPAIRQMTWHYVTLVVPLTSLFIICTGAKRFSKNSMLDTSWNVNCNCASDPVVAICQYTNFAWLLIFRPLLSLVALLQHERKQFSQMNESESSSGSQDNTKSLPLDLGSHLVLVLIAILLPFSKRFGLFSPPQTISHDTSRTKVFLGAY